MENSVHNIKAQDLKAEDESYVAFTELPSMLESRANEARKIIESHTMEISAALCARLTTAAALRAAALPKES